MDQKMHQPFTPLLALLGSLILSCLIAILAALPLHFDPQDWHPTVLWLAKAFGGVVLVETFRRLYRRFLLDRYLPDAEAEAQLRRQATAERKPLGLDE